MEFFRILNLFNASSYYKYANQVKSSVRRQVTSIYINQYNPILQRASPDGALTVVGVEFDEEERDHHAYYDLNGAPIADQREHPGKENAPEGFHNL